MTTSPVTTSLSLFQKVLLATDGTVTDLIALYCGETIHVKKLHQEITRAVAPAELLCDEPKRLLNRRILLAGSVKNFLYAESTFVFERFSKHIQQELLDSDRPIGLLWKEEKLETYREVISHEIAPDERIAGYFDLSVDAAFVARTYLIFHGSRPLGAITEKWPLAYFRD